MNNLQKAFEVLRRNRAGDSEATIVFPKYLPEPHQIDQETMNELGELGVYWDGEKNVWYMYTEINAMNAQQRVYFETAARGYRDGWTPEQFVARQIAKLAEELAEASWYLDGDIDGELMNAIRVAGRLARQAFDNQSLWKGDIEIADGIETELADCQVVLYNVAEGLTEITGKAFDISGEAIRKAKSDKKRGVR